jgi:hypothetical protein
MPRMDGFIMKSTATSQATAESSATSSNTSVILTNCDKNNTRRQDFGTRMNAFALNLTCAIMHKSEKIFFRGLLRSVWICASMIKDEAKRNRE